MKNQLTLRLFLTLMTGIAVLYTALESIALETSHIPDSPAKLDKWVSPEPAADHIHSNGKEVISFVSFATCVDAGLENAKQVGRPLLVYIKKPGCPHCASFETGVLRQPKLKQFIEANFICARVLNDSTDDRVLKKDFGCNAYPHFVIFSQDGKLMGKWFGLPKSGKDFTDTASTIQKPQSQP